MLVLKCKFVTAYKDPGGFRELREACRNHCHLSWYLSDSMVPNYGSNPWGGFVSVYDKAVLSPSKVFTGNSTDMCCSADVRESNELSCSSVV